MRVSLVMLTYNRAEFVERVMAHNMANAGATINELIWVDNGSTDCVSDVMRQYDPDVCILNKANLGVSKGYNRGFAVATGDYIVITDSDMLMPDAWLATFLAYLIAIPHTGVACMFHHEIRDKPRPVEHFNGFPYHPCLPWGRRIVSREMLIKQIGYLCEDFGLYGWEDIEWAHRALRVCRLTGRITYSIPEKYAEHLGTHALDPADYRAFKTREGDDPRKREVLERCRAYSYPYVNPFA
jgi:glycosyltransferase involved in cell wall biosynthesis